MRRTETSQSDDAPAAKDASPPAKDQILDVEVRRTTAKLRGYARGSLGIDLAPDNSVHEADNPAIHPVCHTLIDPS